jgi:ubiquinone/menaquinone biosynthesis C-methylase UbiE
MSTLDTLDTLKSFKTTAWTSDDTARRYERNTSSQVDYLHFLTGEFVKELTQRVPAPASVLDLGCGTGVLTLALAEQGYHVTGLDISPAMLEQVRPKIGRRHVTLQQGDVFNLPFPDASFDGAATRWVIPHFRDWPLILKEAGRVLRPGAFLVFDHCSRANYESAERHRPLDYAKFGWDPRGRGDDNLFYASAGLDELWLAANVAGMNLVEVAPLGFFRQNALIAASLGGDLHTAFKTLFEQFYQDPNVQKFVQWFDLAVTRRMPLETVNGLAVVLQKR